MPETGVQTLERKYDISQEEYYRWEDEIVQFQGVPDVSDSSSNAKTAARTTQGIISRKAKNDG
jgi:hypothetical protein